MVDFSLGMEQRICEFGRPTSTISTKATTSRTERGSHGNHDCRQGGPLCAGAVGVLLPVSMTSAAWTNEVVGGKDALVQLAVLLAATERMVFGTSIANMWVRPPQTAHGAAALLSTFLAGSCSG